ncbi:3-phosphoserine/phosphohydroxythreonine transaminase [Ruminococcaceae bacterium OttesenSCG-928-I18]|nr:3-phosphoserine/phosphohydroxythreonine transaminase [Ruminococcaceae bacterium OttesenSCG-928-I18]
MPRLYNFSAGPSILPVPVLEQARDELMDYKGSGMSVMEMSHRSKVYDEIIVHTEEMFHKVMNIPDDYKVLFLQGGATMQFAMVPMNLLAGNGIADYTLTGTFSTNAYKEAQKFEGKTINVAGSTKDVNFVRIPQQNDLTLDAKADYFHMCQNNTIVGSRWNYLPDTGSVPIVSDMSSCILSEPVDVSKYGLIYAGAQKNIAPAGLTVVIIKKDLLHDPLPGTPTMLNYKTMAEKDSMYNTPPTYSIYMAMLVLEWIEKTGGLEQRKKFNQEKAGILYDYLDSSSFYSTAVEKDYRSMMNVTFKTPNEDLDAKFVKESAQNNMSNLKGHRSVGGLRASIYNAMPKEGVQHLVDFMEKFAKENG